MSYTPKLARPRLLLVLLAAVIAGCGSVSSGTPSVGDVADGENVAPHPWTLEGATPDGQTLFITSSFGGVASNCARFEGFEAESTAEAVTVTANLWTNPDADACTADGAVSTLMLELGEPLGDRSLLGCGVDDCRHSPSGLYGGSRTVRSVGNDVAVVNHDLVIHLTGETGELTGSTPIQGQATTAGDVLIVGTREGMAGLDDTPGDGSVWEGIPLYGPRGKGGDELVFGCEEGGIGLHAVDPRTGDVLWVSDSAPCSFVELSNDVVFAVGYDPQVDGGTRLFVLNADTGEAIVGRNLDDGIDDQVDGFAGIVTSDGMALLAGYQSDTVLLDSAGDEVARWANRLGRPLAMTGETIVLERSESSIGVFTIAVDEWIWDRNEVNVSELSIDGGQVAVGRADGVDLIDVETGDVLWSTTIGFASGFHTTLTESSVLVTSDLVVAKLDRETGDLLWWTQIPLLTDSAIQVPPTS